jgi:hypothetical protein
MSTGEQVGSEAGQLHPALAMLQNAIPQVLPGTGVFIDETVLDDGRRVPTVLFAVPLGFASGRAPVLRSFLSWVQEDPRSILWLERMNVNLPGKKGKETWDFSRDEAMQFRDLRRVYRNLHSELELEWTHDKTLVITWLVFTDGLTAEFLRAELERYTRVCFDIETALTLLQEGNPQAVLSLILPHTSMDGYLYSDPMLRLCEEGLRMLPRARFMKTPDGIGFQIVQDGMASYLHKHGEKLWMQTSYELNIPPRVVKAMNDLRLPYVSVDERHLRIVMEGTGIDKPEEIKEAFDGMFHNLDVALRTLESISNHV